MADESEKRFHSIMEKLFHDPPKAPSSSSRGKKRPNPSSALALVEPSCALRVEARQSLSEAPLCRPWDRGDLMRRLATFKSMTWFAKPEAVSALNCARRGWINVDIDTISCDACGSRFLFSTPSAWNQQQVEKAAAVFSLKLEKGHRLHCPWINNVCDDTLSRFPPIPPPVLVEKFKQRCIALLRVSALPVISSFAVDHMKSPQFEQFFEQSLMLDCENGSGDISRTECLGEEHNVDSEKKYYKALKLISLCGWEPRTLPYVVDTGCKLSPNTSVDVQYARIHKLTEANGSSEDSNRPLCDPDSVVLDCKLCGASVGLWTFATLQRPMEFVRLVGSAEISSENQHGSDGATTSKERHRSLNLTIAGGPPPATQNFKATISLPVIGRNLRARFCGDAKFGDRVLPEQGRFSTRGHDSGKENESRTSVEEIYPIGARPIFEGNVSNDEAQYPTRAVEDNSVTSTKETASKIGPDGGNDSSLMVLPSNGNLLQISGTNTLHGGDSVFGADEETQGLPFCLEGDLDIDITYLFGQTVSDRNLNDQESGDCNLQISVNNELVSNSTENELKQPTETDQKDQGMEFDPIRQHRHFCPWIASTQKAAPGWKQTLYALLRQKGFSPLPEKSPSTSLIKVDDPITSVRNLFTSPSLKRLKQDLSTNQSTQN